MNISEIISDALVYPLNNVKSLIIYIILGIIAGIALVGAFVGLVTGANVGNTLLAGGAAVIGMLVGIIIVLLIMGYELDIIKYGINRSSDAPSVDIVRQVTNAIKLIVVRIVYYLIPAIIAAILSFLLGNGILTQIVIFLIAIVFSLALFMANCRLAKTEDLSDALAIGEAIGDISRVGIINILALTILIFIIAFIAILIVVLISKWNATIGGILMGILFVYLTFFSNRAIGLLYSNA